MSETRESLTAIVPVLHIERFDAMLFDLDGVVTHTPRVHAAAWKDLFDEFLREYAFEHDVDVAPFDPEEDYRCHVDGRPRAEGIDAFLRARGIALPYGNPNDRPDVETCCGIGNRKKYYFRKHLELIGVEVYETTRRLIRVVRAGGCKTAVVSASQSLDALLRSGGLGDLFDVRIGGLEVNEMNLRGKPAPDAFLKAIELLGVQPERTCIFEDSIAGVQAAAGAHPGLVVGVDRRGHHEALKDCGADIVVDDLGELKVA